MGEAQVTKDQMFIIDYVKDHLQNWMEEKRIIPFSPKEIPLEERSIDHQLLERMVRVEEGLKHQNENIEKMMVQMDHRFESMDQRFRDMREDMNTRFDNMKEDMDRRFNRQGQFLIVIFAAIVTTAVTVLMQQ